YYDNAVVFDKDATKRERFQTALRTLKGWARENEQWFRLYAEFEDSFGDVRDAILALDQTPDGRVIPKRRFADHAPLNPENVMGLPDDNPAVIQGRTLFPSTVVPPADSPALLI